MAKKNGGGALLGRSPAALRASIGEGLRGSPETRPTETLKGSIWSAHLEGSKGVLLDTPEGARRGVTWVLQSSRIGGLYDFSSHNCRGSVWSLWARLIGWPFVSLNLNTMQLAIAI